MEFSKIGLWVLGIRIRFCGWSSPEPFRKERKREKKKGKKRKKRRTKKKKLREKKTKEEKKRKQNKMRKKSQLLSPGFYVLWLLAPSVGSCYCYCYFWQFHATSPACPALHPGWRPCHVVDVLPVSRLPMLLFIRILVTAMGGASRTNFFL